MGTRALWRHEVEFTASAMRLEVSGQLDGVKPLIADSNNGFGLPSQQGFRQLCSVNLDPDRGLAHYDPPHYVSDKLMLRRDFKIGPALGQIQGAVRSHILLWTAFQASGALVGGREQQMDLYGNQPFQFLGRESRNGGLVTRPLDGSLRGVIAIPLPVLDGVRRRETDTLRVKDHPAEQTGY